jgi:hypothetical protein
VAGIVRTQILRIKRADVRCRKSSHPDMSGRQKEAEMKKAILATKVGMTQIFKEDGTLVPVTVLEAGPCALSPR